jgi:cyclase
MRIVDISSPIDAKSWSPDPVEHTVMTPAEGARHMAAELRAQLGIEFDPAILPDREFLNLDTFRLTAHTGTHVDAPSHYGSIARYGSGRPRTIDEMPLEWFFAPGFVLDVRRDEPGLIGRSDVTTELDRIEYDVSPGDIALLHTGADRWAGTPRYFSDFAGLDGAATHFLLDLGVRVIGTDAFSLDAPFPYIVERFQSTGDRALLWPAHITGRDREYCQIEQLANLDRLPVSHGFTVCCLPVKLAGSGAAWTRAVALLH